MKSKWLKIAPAAVLSTAVCLAPGCGGGSHHNRGSNSTIVPGVLTPVAPGSTGGGAGTPTPTQSSINALEQCSGLNLSRETTLLGDEQSIANEIMNDLLGFELGNSATNLSELMNLGNFLSGNGPNGGQINRVLSDVQRAVRAEVTAGRLTPADRTSIDNLVGIIRTDLGAGLPGGSDQLTGEIDNLATALQGLSFANDQSGVKARVFDVVGGVLAAEGDLLNAVSNRDINATGAAYFDIVTSVSDLQNDCNGVSSGVLDNPGQAIHSMLKDSNLPLIGQLYSALGTQLGSTPFGDVVTSLINGNFTSLGGVTGLQTTLTGGSTAGGFGDLQQNLTLLGNLLGPLAGLSSGGLPALSLLTASGTISPPPSFTSLLNLIPLVSGSSGLFGLGGTAITPPQAGSLLVTFLTPVGGVAPISSLSGVLNGGNVLGNLGTIGSSLGGLGGILP